MQRDLLKARLPQLPPLNAAGEEEEEEEEEGSDTLSPTILRAPTSR